MYNYSHWRKCETVGQTIMPDRQNSPKIPRGPIEHYGTITMTHLLVYGHYYYSSARITER